VEFTIYTNKRGKVDEAGSGGDGQGHPCECEDEDRSTKSIVHDEQGREAGQATTASTCILDLSTRKQSTSHEERKSEMGKRNERGWDSAIGFGLQSNYVPVSTITAPEPRLRFFHRCRSGSYRGSCTGSRYSSVCVCTLIMTDVAGDMVSSSLRNMDMTRETNPWPPPPRAPDSSDPSASVRIPASGSPLIDLSGCCCEMVDVMGRLKELARDPDRARGERPSDLTYTSVSSASGVDILGIS
jgi:hypothetical protein